MWRPLTDYSQLFGFRDGHIWADEATGLADARAHQSMPGELSDYLPRMRAKQVTFHWTTIHWSFADVRLRRVTWAALWAVGLAPQFHGDEIWGRNRLFYYRVYDAKNLADDFEPAKRDESAKAMVRSWVWGPRWSAFGAYDSLDGVASMGGTDESGLCLHRDEVTGRPCLGNRGRKRCPGHGDDAAAPDSAGAPGRRARPNRAQRSEHGRTDAPAGHTPESSLAVDAVAGPALGLGG
jgi:hypothetical protein